MGRGPPNGIRNFQSYGIFTYTGAMSAETRFGGTIAFKINTFIYLKLRFGGRFWQKIWKL